MGAPTDRRVTPGRRHLLGIGAAALAAVAVSACGSSGNSRQAASGNPRTLLRQTFAASHTVRSGVLAFSLVVTPTGSSLVPSPVSLSLAGPFQSRGRGKTPESAFTIGFAGLGKHGSFGVRTTASGAYVSLDGTNYALPAADFAKLRSTLSGSSQGSAPGLSTFGIDPRSWLSDPRIVGTQTIDGTVTEHLHAAVNVPAFVQSLDKVLARESSRLSSAAARSISPARARRIAAAVRNPTVDIYTGRSDSTLRRLMIAATVPVSGAVSTRLGGLRSAAFRLTLDYSDLNAPQTIAAPSNVHSYAELESRLQALGSQLQGLSDAAAAGSTGSSSSGSAGYGHCISAAGNDVAKMEKCAGLLNAAG